MKMLSIVAAGLLASPFAPLSATPLLQEKGVSVQAAAASGASVPRHPLFTVTYVLIPVTPQAEDGPAIEFTKDGRRAAIRPISLSAARGVPLSHQFVEPNVYRCSGWACRDQR